MPEMHSADEAYAYVQSLQQIMRYGGISDCDQEKGQFRCDVNISVHKPGTPFGTKVEIKNLNSTRHIWLSINYEIDRQIELIEDGGEVRQETRRWNDARQETVHMRFKETADDYRYFPEPDLPPVVLSEEQIEKWRAEMPMTPKAYREKFINDFKVTEYDAHVLTLDKSTADFFAEAAKGVKKPKTIANIMMNSLNSLLSEVGKDLEATKLKPQDLIDLVKLQEANVISKSAIAKILPVLIDEDKSAEQVAKDLDLIQQNDTGALEAWVMKLLQPILKQLVNSKKVKRTHLISSWDK